MKVRTEGRSPRLEGKTACTIPDAGRHCGSTGTSVPAAIEAFVRVRLPGARRIELCHAEGKAVIRHGWEPIAEGCHARPGDRVVDLDA